MFDKLNTEYKHGGKRDYFSLSVLLPLSEAHDPTMNALKNNPNLTFEELLKISENGDQSVFPSTSKEIMNIMHSYRKTDSKTESNHQRTGITREEITQSFDEIIVEYTKRKEECSSVLDAYTRNTKQNPLI